MANTKNIAIDELELDPDNAMDHPDENLDAIKASLERFGTGRSIVIDSNDVVRAGNGTVSAARAAGFKSVLVVEPKPDQLVAVKRIDWNEQEARGYGIADNRTAQLAKFNIPTLQRVIDSIPSVEPSDMGFSDDTLKSLFDSVTGPKADVDSVGSGEGAIPDPPAAPVTKLGDVWLLGRHRLYCGDCLELLPKVGPAGCIITDPPYDERTHVGAMYGGGKVKSTIDFKALDIEATIPALLDATERWVVAFCTLEMLGDYARAAGDSWVRSGIWRSPNRTPQFTGDRPAVPADGVAIMHKSGRKHWNGGGHHAYWEYPTQQRDRVHPTQKPVTLIADMVVKFADETDLVVDPFCGSGTTLVACQELDRPCVGIELEPKYCDVIVKRWENLTGDKAQRVSI